MEQFKRRTEVQNSTTLLLTGKRKVESLAQRPHEVTLSKIDWKHVWLVTVLWHQPSIGVNWNLFQMVKNIKSIEAQANMHAQLQCLTAPWSVKQQAFLVLTDRMSKRVHIWVVDCILVLHINFQSESVELLLIKCLWSEEINSPSNFTVHQGCYSILLTCQGPSVMCSAVSHTL